MPLSEGQRRAAAVYAGIADGAMPHSVVTAWQALAAETVSSDSCAPTAAAGAAAYDRWSGNIGEDETARCLRRSLAGWRCLADHDRRPLNSAEPDQFKLARTLGKIAINDNDDNDEQNAVEREPTALMKSTQALDVLGRPLSARPGLVVIRQMGGNTLNHTGREARAEFRNIIGTTVPLAETPDLSTARQALASEFPHCLSAIDAILGDLSTLTGIRWRPSLLVGSPGCGKSRLALSDSCRPFHARAVAI
jgi:hypothetical protein